MAGVDRVRTSTAPRASATFEEQEECSGTYRCPAFGQTLSASLWGLDLYHNLPLVVSRDGIQAERGEFPRIQAFLRDEFGWLAQESRGLLPNPHMSRAKSSYLHTACDLIELRHRDRTIGAIVGAPEDWSTYYVRIFAVSRRYQRPALTRRFGIRALVEPLAAHHVERIVAETSPSNIAMARGLSEMQFHVTGHQLSDRWGPLVRYTRFLDPACEAAFSKRFAGIAPPASRPIQKEEPR